jgi:hypothetical protein
MHETSYSKRLLKCSSLQAGVHFALAVLVATGCPKLYRCFVHVICRVLQYSCTDVVLLSAVRCSTVVLMLFMLSAVRCSTVVLMLFMLSAVRCSTVVLMLFMLSAVRCSTVVLMLFMLSAVRCSTVVLMFCYLPCVAVQLY